MVYKAVTWLKIKLFATKDKDLSHSINVVTYNMIQIWNSLVAIFSIIPQFELCSYFPPMYFKTRISVKCSISNQSATQQSGQSNNRTTETMPYHQWLQNLPNVQNPVWPGCLRDQVGDYFLFLNWCRLKFSYFIDIIYI